MNSEIIKPLLARDVDESKLKFPLWVMPKIDGVYLLVQNAKAYGRSLKQHENKFITAYYSNQDFEGLRGELTFGDNPVAEGLVRDTSSACSTIEGEPETHLWCFDYVTPETVNLSYAERWSLLKEKVQSLQDKYKNINCIAYHTVLNLKEYKEYIDKFMYIGFEGVIIRDPWLAHKEGRSSSVKMHLWRWKPWSSAEIKVTNLVEEMQNMNEAKKNELGKTERSSHKDNKVPKGTLGAIQGTLVTPLRDYAGKVVADVGTFITVSTGCLTAKGCKYYWENPSEMLDKIVEFDYMSFGLKDNGRFNQFKRIRSKNDM